MIRLLGCALMTLSAVAVLVVGGAVLSWLAALTSAVTP